MCSVKNYAGFTKKSVVTPTVQGEMNQMPKHQSRVVTFYVVLTAVNSTETESKGVLQGASRGEKEEHASWGQSSICGTREASRAWLHNLVRLCSTSALHE